MSAFPFSLFCTDLYKGHGAPLSSREEDELNFSGYIDLLRFVAKGVGEACNLIKDRFAGGDAYLETLLLEEKLPALALAGAFIMALSELGGNSEPAEFYFEHLRGLPEMELPAVRNAMVLDFHLSTQWKTLKLHEVGAMEYLNKRVFDGETDPKFLSFVKEQAGAGHFWAVLVILIDFLVYVNNLGDLHFPGVVTREYLAEAARGFALVEDFGRFNRCQKALFFLFFLLLIRAFNAQDVGFRLPFVGGNLAFRFCQQVPHCQPSEDRLVARLFHTTSLGIFSCEHHFFSAAGRVALAVFYFDDNRVYERIGLASSFNLLKTPGRFVEKLHLLWESATGDVESPEEPFPPASGPEHAITRIFSRYRTWHPEAVFSLGLVQEIPSAASHGLTVEGASLKAFCEILQHALELESEKKSFFTAFVFATEKYSLPVDIIRTIHSHATGESLGEFLHQDYARTALQWVYCQKAQRQWSRACRARIEEQKRALDASQSRLLAAEQELEKQKARVATLLEERDEAVAHLKEVQNKRGAPAEEQPPPSKRPRVVLSITYPEGSAAPAGEGSAGERVLKAPVSLPPTPVKKSGVKLLDRANEDLTNMGSSPTPYGGGVFYSSSSSEDDDSRDEDWG